MNYSNMNTNSVGTTAELSPSKSSNLRREADVLDKEIIELHAMVGDLMGRLNPVLLAPAPQNQGKPQAIQGSVCPLSGALFGFHQRVSEVRAMLADINQRLDI